MASSRYQRTPSMQKALQFLTAGRQSQSDNIARLQQEDINWKQGDTPPLPGSIASLIGDIPFGTETPMTSINQLPDNSSLNANDLLVIVQNGVSKKVTWGEIFSLMQALLGGAAGQNVPAGLLKGLGGSFQSAIAGTDFPGLGSPNIFTVPQTLPVQDKGGQVFNVKAYGAKGDGVTDDTAAIQAAITAAIAANGTVLFSAPSVSYLVNSTLNILPASGPQVHMNMRAESPWPVLINWGGGNNASVFYCAGWKNSRIDCVTVNIPAGVTGVIGWDLDNTATANSLSNLVFTNCLIGIGSGSTGCVGWRLGHGVGWNTGLSGTIDANGDISFLQFVNCTVQGPGRGASPRNVGWSNEHGNVLQNTWNNGFAIDVDVAITNVPTPGAACVADQGGDSMYFFGFGTSHNALEFEFKTSGSYGIYGGRYEVGQKFLSCPNGGGSAVNQTINLTGVHIDGFNPSDGIIFDLQGAVDLTLDTCSIRGDLTSGLYGSSMFMCSTSIGTPGFISIRGCQLGISGEPFWTFTQGNWSISIENTQVNGTLGDNIATGTTGDTRTRVGRTSVPTTGTWKVGDFVVNLTPSSSGVYGWVCTTAGTPGTWVGVPLLYDAIGNLAVLGSNLDPTLVHTAPPPLLAGGTASYIIAFCGQNNTGPPWYSWIQVRHQSADVNGHLKINPLGGSIILGESLATNAIDGFLYIPTCSGTPTGTPTSWSGTVPLVYDVVGKKLMIYNGSVWEPH